MSKLLKINAFWHLVTNNTMSTSFFCAHLAAHFPLYKLRSVE